MPADNLDQSPLHQLREHFTATDTANPLDIGPGDRLPLGDDREQVEYCRRIQSEGLSVRVVEELVQETIHAGDEPAAADEGAIKPLKPKPSSRSKQTAGLEQQLRLALGTKVDIRSSGKGRGKIVVHFANADEFERLLQYLSGPNFQSAAG